VLVEPIESEAARAVVRGRARPAPSTTRPVAVDETPIEDEVRAELARAVGPTRVARYESRLADAGRAFRAERFQDAARILKKLAEDAPGAASVRELYGVTLYRQEKWRAAAKELEAFHLLTGSTEQHPVLADCHRALRHWDRVDELWAELREASPSAELVTEGRIVQAGSLADRGDVVAAVALLEEGWRFPKRPREHHLRRAYALADAYERAGDVLRARELFDRIHALEPDFADVARRVRALR
jgi:tetratricopeptide (TPR) repeat protein